MRTENNFAISERRNEQYIDVLGQLHKTNQQAQRVNANVILHLPSFMTDAVVAFHRSGLPRQNLYDQLVLNHPTLVDYLAVKPTGFRSRFEILVAAYELIIDMYTVSHLDKTEVRWHELFGGRVS